MFGLGSIQVCLLQMVFLPWQTWLRLLVWLILGLCYYFFRGQLHGVGAQLLAGTLVDHDAAPDADEQGLQAPQVWSRVGAADADPAGDPDEEDEDLPGYGAAGRREPLTVSDVMGVSAAPAAGAPAV